MGGCQSDTYRGNTAALAVVCTFLDAVDVTSFRGQMLPRLQQMEQMQAAADDQGAPTPLVGMEEEEERVCRVLPFPLSLSFCVLVLGFSGCIVGGVHTRNTNTEEHNTAVFQCFYK